MTPTQLRAYSAVVRLGSVKLAAAQLEVSEAAVSLHIGQLRRELGDQLFSRTSSGLAFTPGGLRLASRAAELLGLQDITVLEVSAAGRGRRLLQFTAPHTGLDEVWHAHTLADQGAPAAAAELARFAMTPRASIDTTRRPAPVSAATTPGSTQFVRPSAMKP